MGAEAAYEATAAPEADAVKRATEARQQFEVARDALAQGCDTGAPVAEPRRVYALAGGA